MEAFIERDMGLTKKSPMRVVHSEHSALFSLVVIREKFSEPKSAVLTSITDKVAECKRSVVAYIIIDVVAIDYLH